MEKTSTHDIYNELKKRIVILQYEPDHVLNEVDLADEFKVSRTPIRSVLKKLEGDGLLKIVPRYGVQVTQIDFRKMKSLFEMTKVLDPFATRLAVHNIKKHDIERLKEIVKKLESYDNIEDYQDAISDDEIFHKIITKNSENPWLITTLSHLHLHSERLWHYCDQYFDDMAIFTRTFRLIIDAIERRDEADAEKYAREHIDDFVEKIKIELL